MSVGWECADIIRKAVHSVSSISLAEYGINALRY